MPKFFFHFELNGQRVLDHDGTELPDAETALRQAAAALAAIANDEAMNANELNLGVEVEATTGLLVGAATLRLQRTGVS